MHNHSLQKKRTINNLISQLFLEERIINTVLSVTDSSLESVTEMYDDCHAFMKVKGTTKKTEDEKKYE